MMTKADWIAAIAAKLNEAGSNLLDDEQAQLRALSRRQLALVEDLVARVAVRRVGKRVAPAASSSDCVPLTPGECERLAAAAIEHLEAKPDPEDPARWIYFAAETRSWWSVTHAALVTLGLLLDEPEAYHLWAETDNTALERKAHRAR